MDTKKLLDQLMQAGRSAAAQGGAYAEKAQDYAADKMGVESGERDSFGKGALGGALAAGVLTLLLGTRGGRKVGGAALKVGALAGISALAYKAWQKMQGAGDPGEPLDQLEGQAAETRASAILAALISAAKADGHIDDREREVIATRMRGLEGADKSFIDTALAAPSDPEAVAKLADSPQAAREMYAASVFMVDASAPDERAYLDRLASALGFDAQAVQAIETEIKNA